MRTRIGFTVATIAALLFTFALGAVASGDADLSGDTAGTVVVDGTDRYDTAAQIALGTSVPGAGHATSVLYIANGETAIDALAVGVTNDGPAKLLLVTHDEVPAPTAAALEQINHAKLVFLGGPDVISPSVRDQVAALTCNYALEDCTGR